MRMRNQYSLKCLHLIIILFAPNIFFQGSLFAFKTRSKTLVIIKMNTEHIYKHDSTLWFKMCPENWKVKTMSESKVKCLRGSRNNSNNDKSLKLKNQIQSQKSCWLAKSHCTWLHLTTCPLPNDSFSVWPHKNRNIWQPLSIHCNISYTIFLILQLNMYDTCKNTCIMYIVYLCQVTGSTVHIYWKIKLNTRNVSSDGWYIFVVWANSTSVQFECNFIR